MAELPVHRYAEGPHRYIKGRVCWFGGIPRRLGRPGTSSRSAAHEPARAARRLQTDSRPAPAISRGYQAIRHGSPASPGQTGCPLLHRNCSLARCNLVVRHGVPCRHLDSCKQLRCPGPPLDPSGRARGGFCSVLFNTDTSMRHRHRDGSLLEHFGFDAAGVSARGAANRPMIFVALSDG